MLAAGNGPECVLAPIVDGYVRAVASCRFEDGLVGCMLFQAPAATDFASIGEDQARWTFGEVARISNVANACSAKHRSGRLGAEGGLRPATPPKLLPSWKPSPTAKGGRRWWLR